MGGGTFHGGVVHHGGGTFHGGVVHHGISLGGGV